jgi:DNA-binding protein HU-beta
MHRIRLLTREGVFARPARISVPSQPAAIGSPRPEHPNKRPFVNKAELIEVIAVHADISKAAAGRALEATITSIQTSLKKGDVVTLVGFGTFSVGKRAARTGRNPRTGTALKIKASRVPKFRAGKALRDAIR